MTFRSCPRGRVGALILLFALLAAPINLLAQTQVVAPKNPYKPDKDVQLGQQAAAEVEHKIQLLNDSRVQHYVEQVGRRLAEGIPAEFQHPEFRYSYKVTNQKDINAFALPGGFTYVNRGLIEAAKNEGEMAGAIAHEISHVALRHGTAQAAKAQKYQTGSAVVGVLGSVLGVPAAGQLGQMGIGAYFMKFSREYEKQADILGSHIMANAGYDPHDLANMFKTLEQQGGKGGPQWLSDHPNPGNRVDYINKEADALALKNPTHNTDEFMQVQALLRGGGADLGRGHQGYPQQGYPQQGNPQQDPRYQQQGGQGGRYQQVPIPSSRFRSYNESFFSINVPDNWRELRESDNVTFAPEGGYVNNQGQFSFTHGVQVGTSRGSGNKNLKSATDQLLQAISQGNPNLRKAGGYEREYVGRRDGLSISLTNVSDVTGRPEMVMVYTTLLRNGDLFYLIGVAPEEEFQNYQRSFVVIVQNIAIND
ncbi:MAG TPA: M48 family metallopeptidase [Blastocatellia bacterium]|nr:M48 family metallopeptidase [Blastocatellia bacterium]